MGRFLSDEQIEILLSDRNIEYSLAIYVQDKQVPVVPRKGFGSADCDTIYNIYISLCTRLADLCPFFESKQIVLESLDDIDDLDIQIVRQIDRQIDSQIDRQLDRQIDRHTNFT